MRKYILVIDEGTTGVRACIFDRNMNLIGSEYETLQLYYPEPGAVECDAEEIYEKVVRTCRNVITNLNIELEDVECAGITTQRTTWVCWNKETGRPLRKAVVWLDGRGASQMEKFKKDEDFNKKFPGLTEILPAAAPIYAMDKIKEQEPEFAQELTKETTLWGNIDAWIIWKLTKGRVFATVSSIASISMMYALQYGMWNQPLAEYMGLALERMPMILDEADDFGAIDQEFLGKEIPIRSNIADQQAALFGQGCLKENTIKCTNGTGTFIDINVGTVPTPVSGLIPLAAWRLDGKMTYCLEGFSSTSGACLEWAKNQFELFNDFSEMDFLVSQVENSGGLYFVPALSGLQGFPYDDASARGAYMGISPDVTKKHFVRATLEGLSYAVSDIVKHIIDAGIAIDEIKVSGGVSQNNFLCQVVSNVVERRVVRPVSIEATALGAAELAAIRSEWFGYDKVGEFAGADKVFEPDNSGIDYEKEFRKWKDVISRTLKWEL